MKNITKWLIIVLTILSMGNKCDPEEEPIGIGSTIVKIEVAGQSASDISWVEITLKKNDTQPEIVMIMGKEDGIWSEEIENIEAGIYDSFTAEAFDSEDNLVYDGEVTDVTIEDEAVVGVTIFLPQTVAPNPPFNSPPKIAFLVVSDLAIGPSKKISLRTEANDPDKNPITYKWTATGGTFSNFSTPSTTWTAPNTEGDYQLAVSATDNYGASVSTNFDMYIYIYNENGDADVVFNFNASPEIQGLIPNPTRIDVGESTSLNLTTMDPDGTLIFYEWTTNCNGVFDDDSIEDPKFTLLSDNNGEDCVLSTVITDGYGGISRASISITTGAGIL